MAWRVTWLSASHYLNKCWKTVNLYIRNKFKWNFKQNSYIFIQEKVFENVVWKMAAILSRPQCILCRSDASSIKCDLETVTMTNISSLSLTSVSLRLVLAKYSWDDFQNPLTINHMKYTRLVVSFAFSFLSGGGGGGVPIIHEYISHAGSS